MTHVSNVHRWASVLLLSLVGVAFANSLNGSFQFDDWAVIVNHTRVQSIAAWWHSMPGIRALLKLSYALNHQLAAGPTGFRVTNVALHGINCLLLFAVLRRLADAMTPDRSAATQLAAFVANVAFAVHPVQTESVTYVSGRSNVLSASFALATLYCWLRANNAPRRWVWTAVSLVSLLLAAASKETALITPLALWLCWACLPTGAREQTPRPWPETLWAVALTVAALTLLPYDYLLDVSLGTRSVLQNLAAQTHGVWYLLGQLTRFDRLNADPALPAVTHLTLATAWTMLAMGAALVYGVASVRRRPTIAFGILWFFVWLAPTNSLLARLDVVNDRQLYLAIAGPGWLLGLALAPLLRRRKVVWSGVAVAALASVLVVGTILRNRVYASEVSFWSDVLNKSPHNSRAANNLGMAYALECQRDAALNAFRAAERLDPDNYRAAVNRALLEADALPGMPPQCQSSQNR